MLTKILNSLWMWQSRGEHQAFLTAASRIQQHQQQLLFTTLQNNAECCYGRQYRFASIKSLNDYQNHVPICDYESLKPQMDAILSGQQGILTTEPVLMMEPTGGSSGGGRLIPYTATLRQQFQTAISAWMHDVLWGHPGCRQGSAYWSISPAAQKPVRTAGRIRIGFDNDTEYLAGWQRWAMNRLLAVPSAVSQIRHIENFQYATLACLMATRNLALISIWSPTFLTTLLARLPNWALQIVDDIGSGQLHWPQPSAADIPERFPFQRDQDRSWVLRKLLSEFGPTPAFIRRCWPSLSLVSAWGDAAASMFVPALQYWLPEVPFQPKGLLATEGVTSFPLTAARDSALAIRSHVFEFVPAEATAAPNPELADRPKWAWQLEQGCRYQVLLTTGGGLYRYATGDEILVTGYLQQCPLVKFIGRAGAQSDLVGEKLHEQHVREGIAHACEAMGFQPSFAMLITTVKPIPGYRVVLVLQDNRQHHEPQQDCDGKFTAKEFKQTSAPQSLNTISWSAVERQLSAEIEERLFANSQYKYAVGLGQLHPLETWILPTTAEQAWAAYESECRRRGQKSGDIKPTTIARGHNWEDVFCQLRSGS